MQFNSIQLQLQIKFKTELHTNHKNQGDSWILVIKILHLLFCTILLGKLVYMWPLMFLSPVHIRFPRKWKTGLYATALRSLDWVIPEFLAINFYIQKLKWNRLVFLLPCGFLTERVPTKTKPYPTKWGRLHGSKHHIILSYVISLSNSLITRSFSSDLTTLHLTYSPYYKIYRSSLYMVKQPKPSTHKKILEPEQWWY